MSDNKEEAREWLEISLADGQTSPGTCASLSVAYSLARIGDLLEKQNDLLASILKNGGEK